MVRHGVISRHAALVSGGRIHAQRADAIPCRHHVAPAHRQARIQILLALVDQVLDFVLWHLVVKIRLGLHVCGADQRVALPRDEEQEGAARSHHVDHAQMPRAIVLRQDDVCPSRAVHARLDVLALAELAETICEGASGVDHLLGPHGERLGTLGRLVRDLRAAGPAVPIEDDLVDLRVVHDAGPAHGRRQRDRDVRARVVVGALVEDRHVLHPLAVQLRELLLGPRGGHDVRGGRTPEAQGVVRLEEEHEEARRGAERGRGVVEGRGPDEPGGQRDGNRDPGRDMGVHVQHVGSLSEAPHDHVEGAHELLDCGNGRHDGGRAEQLHEPFDEVSGARPQELGGLGRRTRGEILLLHAGHAEPAELRLKRHASPCGAATHHEDVELLLAALQPRQTFRPAGHGPLLSRLDGPLGQGCLLLGDVAPVADTPCGGRTDTAQGNQRFPAAAARYRGIGHTFTKPSSATAPDGAALRAQLEDADTPAAKHPPKCSQAFCDVHGMAPSP
mmetsp:Transcript_12070/g.32342  ORF Transcript_12070/g.32342 Transcript_12070/m.32342 type:complete len:503 (-) Transcript_12070:2-1510(-)